MPAFRLDSTPRRINRFDVAAKDSEATAEFIRHVGLFSQELDAATNQSSLSLTHMGPPLGIAENHVVQAAGSAELDADELEQVRVFVEELRREYEAEQLRGGRQYVVHPHVREPDETVPCRRFSCAGFVIEAYRDAGIELLPSDEGSRPQVAIHVLKDAYPDLADRLDNPRIREMVGLDGDGPWPVVLAGYVVNALARTRAEILAESYAPVTGDEFFPSRRVS